MALHSAETAGSIHVAYNFSYANAAARNAAVLAATDIGKIARQTDDNTFYILQDDSPLTWREITSVSAGVTTWNTVTAATQAISVANGYIANNTDVRIAFSLPGAASVGDMFRIAGKGVGSWVIEQAAGQTIYDGDNTTETGTLGRLLGSSIKSAVDLLCITANNDFVVVSKNGVVYTQKNFGYIVAGASGGDTPVSSVEELNFTTEAIAASTAFPTTITNTTCVSSQKKGYTMGGSEGGAVTTIRAFLFSAETWSSLSATLNTARSQGCGIHSSTTGYHAGGAPANSVIEDLDFAAETSAPIGATLAANRALAAGAQSHQAGYIIGGNSGAAATTTVYKLTFTGESTSTLAGTLDLIKQNSAGMNSTLKAYEMGGDDDVGPTYRSSINAITFSTDAVATIADTLSVTRSGGCGWSATAKGYLAGGRNGATYYDDITALTYATEATDDISAVLATGRERCNNAEMEY